MCCAGVREGGQRFEEEGPRDPGVRWIRGLLFKVLLLAQYRPDLMHLPTTIGEHRTDDGFKMREKMGGKTIDRE